MRKADHQLQQPLYIAAWQKADAEARTYSVENTGYTCAPVKTFEPYVSSTPTSCQMKRPGAPDRLTPRRRPLGEPRSDRGAVSLCRR